MYDGAGTPTSYKVAMEHLAKGHFVMCVPDLDPSDGEPWVRLIFSDMMEATDEAISCPSPPGSCRSKRTTPRLGPSPREREALMLYRPGEAPRCLSDLPPCDACPLECERHDELNDWAWDYDEGYEPHTVDG